jgi:phosphoribosylaminoimidazolecarboxamide formyltransferase / IMP cyclohydrolase
LHLFQYLYRLLNLKGGTATSLIEHGFKVIPVDEWTGSSEMLGGRVKTLHPAIHAGILATYSQSDQADMLKQGYKMIDIVVCNLYPFERVVKDGCDVDTAIENIDIGGMSGERRLIIRCRVDPGSCKESCACMRID